MNEKTLIGPWVRRFLLEHLVSERNLSHNTQASYRDTLTEVDPIVWTNFRPSLDGGAGCPRRRPEGRHPFRA